MTSRNKNPQPNYEQHFDDRLFLDRVTRFASSAGRAVVRKTLALYYCMKDGETPPWAKALIVGALGYLFFKSDALNDLLMGVSSADDSRVVTNAMLALGTLVREKHWKQAEQSLQEKK
jgi:uncharacterized membrane protein YkvA (DUF1232 family)